MVAFFFRSVGNGFLKRSGKYIFPVLLPMRHKNGEGCFDGTETQKLGPHCLNTCDNPP